MKLDLFYNHPQWMDVQRIAKALVERGFKAYLAGGCVRDMLLGRVPHDFDLATDARPEEVETLFDESVPVGKQFGVILIPCRNFHVEVATFRSDEAYVDGRRPTGVTFTSPREDALRRDFTVNALYFDLQKRVVIDYVNGEQDLANRILRTVGEPGARFSEDKLRLLRAVRLAVQLNFRIENQTLKAIKGWAGTVGSVSAERIQHEMEKLLSSRRRTLGIELMESTGLLEMAFSALDGCRQNPEAWSRTKFILQLIGEEPRVEVVLAHLFWPRVLDEGPSAVNAVVTALKRMKFSTAIGKGCGRLLENLWQLRVEPVENPQGRIKGAILRLFDSEDGPALFDFWQAQLQGQTVEKQAKEQSVLLRVHQEYLRRIGADGHLEKPWVSGYELKKWGVSPGVMMGKLLDEIYNLQLENQLSGIEEVKTWVLKKSLK